MSERKYSVDEIDRMRRYIRRLLNPPFEGVRVTMVDSNHDRDSDNRIELQLRTHMLNGTDPNELRDKVREIELRFMEEIKARREETKR